MFIEKSKNEKAINSAHKHCSEFTSRLKCSLSEKATRLHAHDFQSQWKNHGPSEPIILDFGSTRLCRSNQQSPESFFRNSQFPKKRHLRNYHMRKHAQDLFNRIVKYLNIGLRSSEEYELEQMSMFNSTRGNIIFANDFLTGSDSI